MRFLRALWTFLSRLWTSSPKTDAPPAVLAAPVPPPPNVGWMKADPAEPLSATLAIEARRAMTAGKTPVVFLHAAWCPPSTAVKKTREQPLMADAFAPVHVIEVDIDSLLALQIEDAGMQCSTIPKFYRLDERGKPTGAPIDGGAWGANTPENMAPPLSKFFASSN